jgi:predicted TIM-barrel fold metal-dependent hydrolase
MIIDAHTHISPPEIRNNREKFFEGEDNFRLLYEDPRSMLIGAAELVNELDSWSADKAVSFGFPWSDAGKEVLCNDYVLEAGRRFPERIIPFACVNPLRGKSAIQEARRCLEAGAKGVGEVATYHDGMGAGVREKIAPLAELCADAGVPLLLHTNKPVGHHYPGKAQMSPRDLYELVKAHPRTLWIFAHMGGALFVFHLLKKEADEVLKNVYYDTAALPYLYKPEVFRAFAASAGIGRLLYGSDYPLLGLPRYKRAMEEGGLTEEEKGAVLGNNLAALLGLK